MDIPKCYVLITTFNGEKYLEEQLSSLRNQVGVEVSILANDDGSRDHTFEILEKWKHANHIHHLSRTANVGWNEASKLLLRQVPDNSYVAFSDQDDYWDPHKIRRMLDLLDKTKPQLVSCGRVYIDGSGEIIGAPKNRRQKTILNNAIIENLAPGNTQLINAPALKLLKNRTSSVQYFDHWVYLAIAVFGEVKFLDVPLVKYRLHSDNQVGLPTEMQRFRGYKKSIIASLIQSEAFLSEFGPEIPPRAKKVLIRFVNAFNSRYFIVRFLKVCLVRPRRNSFIETLVYLILAPTVFHNNKVNK